MDDLVRWLGEQLDEDERIARAATEGPWSVDDESYAEAIYGPDRRTTVVAGGRWGGEAPVFESTEDALHIAEWDPARMLREIDAKRRMFNECERAVDYDSRGMLSMAEDFLRLLALPYADRPGFREEWRL